MNHSFSYQPWGNPTASGVFALLFGVWIGVSNMILIVLFITNPKLLNSRQNIVLLHNAIADLTAGVFYCPLASEYYFRGYWAHGCNSFFVWFTFAFPLCFLTTHSVLLLLVMRVLPLCYNRTEGTRMNRNLMNLIFCMGFLFLWGYLSVIGVYLDDSRVSDVHIEIAPKTLCKGVMATEKTTLIDILVYFLPASLCVILLGVVAVREKTTLEIPQTQLQLDTITEQNNGMSLCVLSALTLLTTLLPLPSFLATSIMVRGDTCLSYTCYQWLRALAAMSDWLMMAKSGMLPFLLFTVGDFRSSLRGVFHSFRRVPTTDERHLVPAIEDASRDDDAPFSAM